MQIIEDNSPPEFEKTCNDAHLNVSKTDLAGEITETNNSLSAIVGEQSVAPSELSANNSPNRLITGHAVFLTWPPVVSTGSRLSISSKQYEKTKIHFYNPVIDETDKSRT